MISDFTSSKHVIPIVNGTSALHMSLLVAGIKNNEEVLVPSLSFVATANAVCYIGAIPHFVDIDKNTLGIDPDILSDYLKDIVVINSGETINKFSGRIIKAILPMHAFGHPCRITH